MAERVSLQQVSESCFAVVDPRLVSHVGVVLFSDFTVVIDTGKSPKVARLLRETLEIDFRRPVRYVVVTHYHVDHTAGLSAFADVAVVGSTIVAERLRDLPEWSRVEMEELQREESGVAGAAVSGGILAPSLVFDDKVTIVGDKSLELVACGGHTDCSAYAYMPEEGVLFAGDMAVSGEFPFAGDATADPDLWISTLKDLMALDVEHVVVGHGPLSGPKVLGAQVEFLEALRDSVTTVVDAGGEISAIKIPDLLPVHEGKEWFVDRTLARWHAYYVEKLGR